uniref:ATP synthase complex subunit 8 n=1 Tax=Zebrias crossolepis TaxID=366939 RepID=A0A0X9T4Q2_ZEBCR|nr:ATP synthase F0 subunit 8 [Zebrias crossolepis]AID59815.1 ATP synthase F0 subunit 8 [Zebrias crossolepis]AMA34327.1 ATP synthase F0 subunit 8 [Zebrias crossolepis]
MPQLNPAPWFAILVFSWLVFLVILPYKITQHSYPNEPLLPSLNKFKANYWTWVWY